MPTHELRIKSNLIGSAVGAFILLGSGLSWILAKLNLDEIQSVYVNALIPLIYVGVPFGALFLVFRQLKFAPDYAAPAPAVSARTDKIFIVLFGVALCLTANIVTVIIEAVLRLFGITINYTPPEARGGIIEKFVFFLSMTIIPAVIEEFTMRGVLMGSLRKYGAGFSALMTAILFGIMHGNLRQAPFAIIVGYMLGWTAIKTGSIRTGIIIHALNNAISTIYQMTGLNPIICVIINLAIFIAGLIAVILLCDRNPGILRAEKYTGEMNLRRRIGVFILTPGMVIALGGCVWLIGKSLQLTIDN